MSKKVYQLYKINSTEGADLIISEMSEALSFLARAKGLLGVLNLSQNQGLWIKPCNNIHTLFMNFNIDCLFIDKKLIVKKAVKNLKPFRFAGPIWAASSVIELPSGTIDKFNIQPGDQLYVVD